MTRRLVLALSTLLSLAVGQSPYNDRFSVSTYLFFFQNVLSCFNYLFKIREEWVPDLGEAEVRL